MKTKQFYCMLLCLAGSLLFSQHVNAQVGSVHLNVELPGNGIQKDSAVFIAGSFNGWNPSDSSYCMKRIDSKHYTLEIPCFMNKKYSYKYTLGSWKGVEKAIDNKEIDNRTFVSKKKLKIKDVVALWNQPAPAAPMDTTLLLNKKQMAIIKSLNDSVGKTLPAILPRLLEIMQKGNLNMLSDQPDDALNKQCNKELGEMVTQILDSLGGIMKQMKDALTPEQKQKIREMMKNQDSPTLIMNLIEKLKPNSK